MPETTLVVMLALIQYIVFGVLVGRARAATGIAAPAISGNEAFERVFRAHQNTLEQLVVFVPAVYACAWFMNEMLAVIGGIAFLIGRTMYFFAYSADASKRGAGMIVTVLANFVLILAAIVGAVIAL